MLGRWLSMGLVVACLAGVAQAADYQREIKWADEIKSGLVVGDAIEMRMSSTPYPFLSLFTPGDPDRAVILVHGMGVHPDWGLIGQLRVALNEHGYTTLSLQMPILPADASPDDYRPLVPEGASRISRAVSYLENQGYGKIVLVSHSLGSSMSNMYMSSRPNDLVRAWVSLGSWDSSYAGVKLPVLDLLGEMDDRTVLAKAPRRKASFKNKASKQIKLSGADHFYEGRESEMIAAIEGFLDKQVGKPVKPKVEEAAKAAAPATEPPAADAAKPAEPAPAAPAQ